VSGESVNRGCTRCGRPVATDSLRVGVSFTPDEVAKLARDTTDPRMQARLLCALGTIDRDLERRTRMELASTEPGCASCVVLTEQLDQLQAELEDTDRAYDLLRGAR
jgi:hypothetical protein